MNGQFQYMSTKPDGPNTDDTNLIESIHPSEKFRESPEALLFYAPHVRLLIQNFDSENFKVFNDLKDTLRMLVNGVDASARRIIFETLATKERANLERLTITTKKNIQNIDTKQQKEINEVRQLSSQLIQTVKAELSKIPGQADKKALITDQITKSLAKIEKVVKDVVFIDDNFKKVIDALNASLEKNKKQAVKTQMY